MKIRNRLTLVSSITFGVFFLIASVTIYLSFYSNSEKRIFNDLQRTCLLAAIYYLEKDELPIDEHKQIRQQYIDNIKDIEVGVYNSQNKVAYGESLSARRLTPAILDLTRANKKYTFKSKDHFYVGMLYKDNQGDFVVFVKTADRDFKEQTNGLMIIMGIVLLGGLLIIYLFSRLLSNLAYKPVKEIIKQVNNIETASLEETIVSVNTNDEIQELTDTYNNLLKKISDNFTIQKNFINYVSHEFKTPLASISGHLEVFAQKDRTPGEYNQITQKVLGNVYEIEQILNTLMMLSGLKTAGTRKEIFRADEMLWNINDKIIGQQTLGSPMLQIDFQVEDENLLTVSGLAEQVTIAVYNIIENAVKYADGKPVAIILSTKGNNLQLTIKDSGRGITAADLQNIRKTFFRGSNVGTIKGSGIGLSLALLIFEKNNIAFTINSEIDKGTEVTLLFPEL